MRKATTRPAACACGNPATTARTGTAAPAATAIWAIPVYAIADGIVTFAHNVRTGWGNVVITRHAYRDPTSGQVKYIDTLNGHLNEIMVKTGQRIKRGQ